MMDTGEDGSQVTDEAQPAYSERYVGSKEELESLAFERNGVHSSEGEPSHRRATKERIYTKGPAKNRRTKPLHKSTAKVKKKIPEELRSVNRPLAILLLKHTYHHLLIACFLSIIVETSRFAQPFLVLVIIRANPLPHQNTQYACAIGLILHNVLQALLMTYNRHLTDVIIIKVKVLLNRIIFTKVPLLTESTHQSDLNVNYLSLSSDVDKLCQALLHVQSALVGTLSLVTSCCVLLTFYGVYSLPSLGVVLLTVLLRIYLSAYHGGCMMQAISWTRNRLFHLSDLIFNFNVIKINCSENIYQDRLIEAENKEFPVLQRAFALRGLSQGIGFVTTRLAIYITVVALARDGNDMAFQGLLLLVSYLHTLELHGISRLPLGVGSITYASNLLKRLQETLEGRGEIQRKDSEDNMRLDSPTRSYNNNTDVKVGTETEKLILTKAPTSYFPKEHTEERRYRWIWLYFLTTGPGLIVFPIIFILSLISESTGIASEWWISKSRQSYTTGVKGIFAGVLFSNETFQQHRTMFVNKSMVNHIAKPLVSDLATYTALSLIFILFELVSMVIFVYLILITLHKILLNMRAGLLNTKTNRLSHIHSGAILEAFGSDFHYLFETGGNCLYLNFMHLIRVVCYLAFSCVIYPWVAIPAIPYIIGLILLKIYMREKIQHIEMKEHTLQETLLSHFSDDVLVSWDTSVMRHLAMEKHKWYSLARTRSSLRLKINLFTSFFTACVILQLVSCSQKLETRGVAGLLYVYISLIILYMQDIIADSNMFTNSIKRMQAIASLPSEMIDGEGSWCDWPSAGNVNFTHVKLPGCQHQTPIECDLPAGKKVGLYASEGSYRHGFVSALLSLEDHIGSVRIDDLDTTTVNIHSLRTGVTLIHTNLLVKGITLRNYLDPKDEATDEKIWEVFARVGLKRDMETISVDDDLGDVIERLDTTGRNNLCVSRALLHGSKVVVIWEDSTENDRSVDSTLQYNIRQHLPDATRIKVTPSVRSIITCDFILVLEDGKLENYLSAWHLLVYKEGIYDKLVEEVGQEEAAKIKAVTLGFYRDRLAMDTIEETLEEEGEEEEEEDGEVHL